MAASQPTDGASCYVFCSHSKGITQSPQSIVSTSIGQQYWLTCVHIILRFIQQQTNSGVYCGRLHLLMRTVVSFKNTLKYSHCALCCCALARSSLGGMAAESTVRKWGEACLYFMFDDSTGYCTETMSVQAATW